LRTRKKKQTGEKKEKKKKCRFKSSRLGTQKELFPKGGFEENGWPPPHFGIGKKQESIVWQKGVT